MQVGLECIGRIDVDLMGEVLMLAKTSLDALGKSSRLDISHMGFIGGLIRNEKLTQTQSAQIINCISEKNTSGLRCLCEENGLSNEFSNNITALATLHGTYKEVADELSGLSVNDETNAALRELENLDSVLEKLGVGSGISIDFSIVNDISYYNGIMFQGYIEGVPSKVLSGGRYDDLIRKFGKHSGAIGFAIYIDLLEEQVQSRKNDMEDSGIINIALPKGRLGEKAYEIFEKAGFECSEIKEESRKLVFENRSKGIRYFWVKPSDVSIYVERGVADIGVVGKDILLEDVKDVYELLDLGIGVCKICVAAEKGKKLGGSGKAIKVATKFPNIALNHYANQGVEIDVIKLNGSIELAPLLGLSDVIVDIVETGKTLYANNMEPTEDIAEISARLISNKASYKFNQTKIDDLCSKIQRGEAK